jgi:hypothetical protein
LPLSIHSESKFERDRVDSEVFTPPPCQQSQNCGISSLRLWLPFRVSPVHHHEADRDPLGNHAVSTLPRFLPLQRLSIARSHVAPALPNSPVVMRPQGFSPSRRLAPLTTFRAYSIPVPLMGFDPPRLQSPPGAVRPLERRAPKGFSSTKKEEDALPGTHTPRRAQRQAWGLARYPPPVASLGFPAPRSLAPNSEERSHALSSPLALFRLGRRLALPLAPQGIRCQERSHSLSRAANLLAVFHLVTLLDA